MNKLSTNARQVQRFSSIIEPMNNVLRKQTKFGKFPSTSSEMSLVREAREWLSDRTTTDQKVWDDRYRRINNLIMTVKASQAEAEKVYLSALESYRTALLRNIDRGLNILEEFTRSPEFRFKVGDGLKTSMTLLDNADYKLSNLGSVNKSSVAVEELKRATRIINLITEAY